MGRRNVRRNQTSMIPRRAAAQPRVVRGLVVGREAMPAVPRPDAWALEPLESRSLLSGSPVSVWALPAVIDQAHPAIVFQFSPKKGHTRAALSSVVRIDGDRQTRVSIDAVHGIPDCVTIKLPPLKTGGVIKSGASTDKPSTEAEKPAYRPPVESSDDDDDDDHDGKDGHTRNKPRPGGVVGGTTGSIGTTDSDAVIVDSSGTPARPVPSPGEWLELAGELLGNAPNAPRVPPTGVAIVGTGRGGETVIIVQPAPQMPPPLQAAQAVPRPQQTGQPNGADRPEPPAPSQVFSSTPVAGTVRPSQPTADVVTSAGRGYVGGGITASTVRLGTDGVVVRPIALASETVGSTGARSTLNVGNWHASTDSVELPAASAIGLSVRALTSTMATIDPAGAMATEPGSPAGFAEWPAATQLGLANLSSLSSAAVSGIAAWRMTAAISLGVALVGFAYCRAATRANQLQAARIKNDLGGSIEPYRHASTARRRWVNCRVIR